MADKILMLDTSILLDHFRRTKRAETRLAQLADRYDQFVISAITEYEILVGINDNQHTFWTELLAEFLIVPFDSSCVRAAVDIKQQLKRKRKSIETADLFIAATACAKSLSFATLNRKHFEPVNGLKLIGES